MKKTYISPAALTVQLGTTQMMAQSLRINKGGSSISSSDQVLTNENKDVNVWDEEW